MQQLPLELHAGLLLARDVGASTSANVDDDHEMDVLVVKSSVLLVEDSLSRKPKHSGCSRAAMDHERNEAVVRPLAWFENVVPLLEGLLDTRASHLRDGRELVIEGERQGGSCVARRERDVNNVSDAIGRGLKRLDAPDRQRSGGRISNGLPHERELLPWRNCGRSRDGVRCPRRLAERIAPHSNLVRPINSPRRLTAARGELERYGERQAKSGGSR